MDLLKRQKCNHNRMPAGNIGLPQWGLMCFYETLVHKRTAVLLLNFSAKNPPLRQAEKRCLQFYWTHSKFSNKHKQ